MDLHGRIALVTGGGVRVGRALVLALAARGCDVFVHYGKSAGAAEETAEAARGLGVRAATGSADLGDPTVAQSLLAQVNEALGEPTILVNSASGFAEDTVEDVSYEGWLRSHNLTLASPAFLIQALAAQLPADRAGAVVNVTDVRTMRPYRKHFSYIVAKGGVDTLTRAAALALAPRIRVNAVALGVILPPPGEDDAYVAELARSLPMRAAGGTEPVAAAAIALLENDFVTGEIVRVDGGGHLL